LIVRENLNIMVKQVDVDKVTKGIVTIKERGESQKESDAPTQR
jgi:hypothetical protein